ncbi:hypothetical protein AK830_g7931 [Neonectria ditissima]|uniref:BRCT domain-containing protein n=1 Tax=Neonectria ditissima TaxID=78410 RepID=A0A0N8H6D2_9HYPO|nr:hypothetical protein AK830_g7931 [Neonectria ditissima]
MSSLKLIVLDGKFSDWTHTQIINKFKTSKIATAFSPKNAPDHIDYLVSAGGPTTKAFEEAVNAGIPILNEQWLLDAIAARAWVEPVPARHRILVQSNENRAPDRGKSPQDSSYGSRAQTRAVGETPNLGPEPAMFDAAGRRQPAGSPAPQDPPAPPPAQPAPQDSPPQSTAQRQAYESIEAANQAQARANELRENAAKAARDAGMEYDPLTDGRRFGEFDSTDQPDKIRLSAKLRALHLHEELEEPSRDFVGTIEFIAENEIFVTEPYEGYSRCYLLPCADNLEKKQEFITINRKLVQFKTKYTDLKEYDLWSLKILGMAIKLTREGKISRCIIWIQNPEEADDTHLFRITVMKQVWGAQNVMDRLAVQGDLQGQWTPWEPSTKKRTRSTFDPEHRSQVIKEYKEIMEKRKANGVFP